MKVSSQQSGRLRHLFSQLQEGSIDRRSFIQKASLLGVGLNVGVFLANTTYASATGHSGENAFLRAQDASPAASPAASDPRKPDVGTENQTRGEGGELRIMQWQAPTSLSPHVVSGSKDSLGAAPVMEPLMHYGVQSEIIPILVSEVPSAENGGVAEDLTSLTLRLLPDVTWSDGEPFTADDVKFTIDWVQNPDNGAVTIGSFESISGTEVIDPLTIKITFSSPNPFWPDAFTGTSGVVYPKHILESGMEAHDAFISNPIGTGPYIVESFAPNDSVLYAMNENYREPNKPFFSTISLKGGGDAAAAARAVVQTGEYDFAWNLQVEPEVLSSIEGDGSGPGVIMPSPGVSAEKLNINFSDPNTEVDGQRSEMNTPHPILSDIKVREAIAKGIDRQKIADELYGFGQEPPANIVTGAPEIESPNTSWEFNLEAAAQALEDAGWVLDGDVRKKDGLELKLTFAASVNSVRQKTQAVVKSNLESIGFKIELLNIDSSIFFDSSAGNDQSVLHFYWDLSEQQSVPNSPRPIDYMALWYAGPDNSNIAQKSNGWSGANWVRYQNDDYDAAYEAATTEADPQKLAELFITMNDILIDNHVLVPLVLRGTPVAVSNRLRQGNIAWEAPFANSYWNLANWNLAEDAEG